MSFNLIRNARMFFTTNVDVNTGVVKTTGFTATNTKEIQVLDGLSFSQATGSETVTINEAGDAPIRGQRSFNTSLEPVELSFSTYIRPFFVEGSTSLTAFDPDDLVNAEEDVLWNAFAAGYVNGVDENIASAANARAYVAPGTASTNPVTATGTEGFKAAWYQVKGATGNAPYSVLEFANSGKNQMVKFGVIITLDASSYIIDNCALDQASIDFGLDAIATIAWTARGSTLRSVDITANTANPILFGGTYFTAGTNNAKQKVTTAPFLANKLSQITVTSNISGTAGTTYDLALTGGNITFSNNITYLTPANLGTVNKPFTYFTGTRAVSGSVNCYLRTGGSNRSAQLLADMLTGSATDVEPDFQIELNIGGNSSAATRVNLLLPACVLTIPAINTEQVVSSTINFTAQGYSGSAFAIDQNNEAKLTYFSANTTV
jgi:hypothetical protein